MEKKDTQKNQAVAVTPAQQAKAVVKDNFNVMVVEKDSKNISPTMYTTASDYLHRFTNEQGQSLLYVKKDGMGIQLQNYANKHKGIKTFKIAMVSRAAESGPKFLETYKQLPDFIQKEVWRERHGKVEMFTSPEGEAIAHTLIVFGDGTIADFECVSANKSNVKMSTIHPFLDVMAATRSFRRTVGHLTAGGKMNTEMIKEFDNASLDEDDFISSEEDLEKEALRLVSEGGAIEDQGTDTGSKADPAAAGAIAENAGNA